MGLNWNIEKCERIPKEWSEEHQKMVVTDEFWSVLDDAIWGMVGVGIGWELTDEKAPLFYARYKIMAELNGFTPLTPEQVYQLVGLKTNTSPETDTAWRKRMIVKAEDNAKAYYNRVAATLAADDAATERFIEKHTKAEEE